MKNTTTLKQQEIINFIEENLSDVKFTGKTKEEARQFISRHIEASKEAREKQKNDAIRFIFELAESRFQNDEEKLEQIKKYKKLFS